MPCRFEILCYCDFLFLLDVLQMHVIVFKEKCYSTTLRPWQKNIVILGKLDLPIHRINVLHHLDGTRFVCDTTAYDGKDCCLGCLISPKYSWERFL